MSSTSLVIGKFIIENKLTPNQKDNLLNLITNIVYDIKCSSPTNNINFNSQFSIEGYEKTFDPVYDEFTEWLFNLEDNLGKNYEIVVSQNLNKFEIKFKNTSKNVYYNSTLNLEYIFNELIETIGKENYLEASFDNNIIKIIFGSPVEDVLDDEACPF